MWSRIHHTLVSTAWFVKFPGNVVHFLEKGLSDHTPLCYGFDDPFNTDKWGRPFRLFDYMEHPDFITPVLQAWNSPYEGHGLDKVWRKLKHIKML